MKRYFLSNKRCSPKAEIMVTRFGVCLLFETRE